jgi:tight adherence protein C
MTWLVAAGYVAAGWLLLRAVATRADPYLARSLSHIGGETAPTRGWIEAITRRLPLRRSRDNLARLAAASRLPSGAVEHALAWKVLLAAGGAAIGMAAGSPLGTLAFPVLAMAGYRLPEFVLGRRVRQMRAREAARVPDLLDVVAVCVTAGLTPRLALDRAAESVGEPLGGELLRARHEVGLGGSWRHALLGVAMRCGLEEVRRLAGVLERSERLGTPVADPLRELARTVRAERRAREEERARRAPVAMLFPLIFLILPAFVLAAVVPAVLVATRGVQ